MIHQPEKRLNQPRTFQYKLPSMGFCGDKNSSPDPSELSLPDQALAQSSWPLPGACRRLLQHRKRDQRTKYLQRPFPPTLYLKRWKLPDPLPAQKEITANNYQQNKINKKSNLQNVSEIAQVVPSISWSFCTLASQRIELVARGMHALLGRPSHDAPITTAKIHQAQSRQGTTWYHKGAKREVN